MEQINLQKLIKQISPLYNSYKESKGNINGTEALFIMWEIGELLKKKIEEFGIAPHNLYRKIYVNRIVVFVRLSKDYNKLLIQ